MSQFANVGASLFMWGFDTLNCGFHVREVGLCDWRGKKHTLFAYNIPGVHQDDLAFFKTQTHRTHGLLMGDNDRDVANLHHDVTQWLKNVLTEERPKVAVHAMGFAPNVLPNTLEVIKVETHECPQLKKRPIGIVGLYPSHETYDSCTRHGNAPPEQEVWHDICAELMACRLSTWMRQTSQVLPSLEEVNEQRLLWQKRTDALLTEILCEECNKEKEEAYNEGRGIEWIPNCSYPCRTVAMILREGVFYKRGFFTERDGKDTKYPDATLSTLWQFEKFKDDDVESDDTNNDLVFTLVSC